MQCTISLSILLTALLLHFVEHSLLVSNICSCYAHRLCVYSSMEIEYFLIHVTCVYFSFVAENISFPKSSKTIKLFDTENTSHVNCEKYTNRVKTNNKDV